MAPDGSSIQGISQSQRMSLGDALNDVFNIDLSIRDSLGQVLQEISPSSIIHAAGEGRVDAVQGRMSEHWQLNVGAAIDIAEFCKKRSIPFIFVSSNAVFGGSATEYADSSTPDPINDYGRLKAEAEAAVLSINPEALIIRPLLMYGVPFPTGRTNPAFHWVNELRNGREIKVVNDVLTQPLWVRDCARFIWNSLNTSSTGAVNLSGGISMSLYEFARLVADVFELDEKLIHPITSDSLPMLAPRPKATAFDLKRARHEFSFIPTTPVLGLNEMKLEMMELKGQS